MLGTPNMVPYSATKFALTGFMEGLHYELKIDKVSLLRVQCFKARSGWICTKLDNWMQIWINKKKLPIQIKVLQLNDQEYLNHKKIEF